MGSKLGSHHAVKRRPAVEKTCPVCSTVFKTWPSVNSTFCSRPCKYEGTKIAKPLSCRQCGTTFTPRSLGRTDLQKGIRHLYCSRSCYAEFAWGEARWVDRFWAKVRKTETCWLWVGTVSRGYGQFWGHPGRRVAHRIAWELANGPIPDGLFVLHNCPDGDNPLCIRPDHLFLGTQQDNMRDMVGKDRSARAAITAAVVRESRRRFAAGEIGPTALAKELGMTRSGVRHMLLGRTWKHI